MITFSGVSLGRTLNGISFAFDGISLCIVSRDIKEAKAVTDLICGIRRQSEGGVLVKCPFVPTVSSQLPMHLTVKELLDSVCLAGGSVLSSYSHELSADMLDRTVRSLTPLDRARAAVSVLFACESDAVIADGIGYGLLKNERQEVLSDLLSAGKETKTAVIYTTDSAAEMEKSEYTLVIHEGKTLFFGKSGELVKKATEPSPIEVRVMGERAKAEAFFDGMGVKVEDGVKKNVVKATLDATTDVDALKRKLRSIGLSLLDVRSENSVLADIYKALQKTDGDLDEQYEDYKEEHAAPRKLELSDFAFNRDEDEEEEE
jgi:ABC-type multidrug transport system ATPase subunit